MIYATANGAHPTLTKCTKMQKEEENIKKDVLNGNGRNGECATTTTTAAREEPPRSAYTHGGRLKFFKDGKFILELERSREGERVSWVSVPRKTFWPPQGTASSTPTYRQESSTSLSDDNSSIQSSPWQRDHSWKQLTPRKNLSKELVFYYQCEKRQRRALIKSKKTRKPLDPSTEVACKRKANANSANTAKSPSPSASSSSKSGKKRRERRLQAVIQSLLDALGKQGPASSPVRDSVVSPRKRFLREMEKDPKHPLDDACLKRSRGKLSGKVASPVRNGLVEEAPTARTTPLPARNSYSITSLLAADDRSAKRSPANSPSHYSPQHPYATPAPPTPTPTAEDRWYTESVDRLRSIELSQHVDKRLCLPYATPPPFIPPFMPPFALPPHYFHAFARGFPGLTAPPTYPLPLPVRPDAPSCSWAAEPPRDAEHRDDIADMPLNLSKHAG